MLRSGGLGRLSVLAVGLGIGAAVASTPGVASADPSTDASWIDQLLGGLSVPAPDPAQALDIQASIFGIDLFPTAGNTATATADSGDIAIAIGNGAHATAASGIGDFAFADGANSIADAGAGIGGSFDSAFDSALVFGSDSTAVAGDVGLPSFFDLAAVFGDMLHAGAGGHLRRGRHRAVGVGRNERHVRGYRVHRSYFDTCATFVRFSAALRSPASGSRP